jgi:hypothetical protein
MAGPGNANIQFWHSAAQAEPGLLLQQLLQSRREVFWVVYFMFCQLLGLGLTILQALILIYS